MEDAVVSREAVETLNVQLRESEERLRSELDATRQLQDISAQLLHERGIEALYDKFIDAAVSIMRSDYASMQMFHPERGSAGELRLLAFRGFNPQAAKFWEWVRTDSGCTCGMAMRTGQRVIAANVETCDFMAGTEDRAAYLQAGICAAQCTPLVSRSGHLLGMISTHWRRPHNPTESDLRRLDVLARQTAAPTPEAALRQSEERQRTHIASSPVPILVIDRDARVRLWNRAAEKLFGWTEAEVLGQVVPFVPASRLSECISCRETAIGGEIFAILTQRIKRDGSLVDVSLTAAPPRNAEGRVTEILMLLEDITERKRHEEHRELLIGELNHRVKNTLARCNHSRCKRCGTPRRSPRAVNHSRSGSWPCRERTMC